MGFDDYLVVLGIHIDARRVDAVGKSADRCEKTKRENQQ